MLKKLFKKIAVATNLLLLFQLAVFGLGVNPGTALAATGATSLFSPTNYSNGPGSYDDWTNPHNAKTSNNSYSVATSSDDVIDFRDFNLSLPSGVSSINGIGVSVEGYTEGVRQTQISLSYDGGAHYTTGTGVGVKTTNLTTAEGVIEYGGALDKWGRSSWTETQLNNTNLRVRLHATTGSGTDLFIDHIALKVYFTVPDVTPTITVNPYITTPTNQDVVVTATTNVGSLNFDSHTFTENDSFDFVATNGTETTTTTVTVTNIDKVAPVIAPMENIVKEATSASGAVVTYTAPVVTDNLDTVSVAVCDFPTGSVFPLGKTTVSCTNTDTAGNPASPVTFTVTVNDTTPSVIEAVGDLKAEATSADGAIVDYVLPNSIDLVDGSAPAVCSPAPGSLFPLGETVVTCTKTDLAGNVSTAKTFKVTVEDTTAPVLTTSDITVTADPSNDKKVSYSVSAIDIVDPNPLVYCDIASGSVFTVGSTTVHCTAVDSFGNSATKSFVVKVVDLIAPLVTVTPTVLNDVTKDNVVIFTGSEAIEVKSAQPIENKFNALSATITLKQGEKTFIGSFEITKIDNKTYSIVVPKDFLVAGTDPLTITIPFVDLAGNPTVSNDYLVNVDTVAPATVLGLTVNLDASGHVVLNWTNPVTGTFDGIRIIRNGVVIATITNPTTVNYTDLAVEKGKTYSYVVETYDIATNKSATVPTSFAVPAAVIEAPANQTVSADVTEVPASEDAKEVKAETTDNTNADVKADKKNSLPLWGIILLIVLAGVGGYLFFSKEDAKPIAQTAPIARKKKNATKKKK